MGPPNNRQLRGKFQSLLSCLAHGLKFVAPVEVSPLNCTCISWTLWTIKLQSRSQAFPNPSSPKHPSWEPKWCCSPGWWNVCVSLLPVVPGFQWHHEAQVDQVGQEVLVGPVAQKKHRVTEGTTHFFSFFFFKTAWEISQEISVILAAVAEGSHLRAGLPRVHRSSWSSLDCKSSSDHSRTRI